MKPASLTRLIKLPVCSVIFLLITMLILQGCASSGATRGAASEADKAYLQADYAATHTNNSLRDTFQNTTQRAKGVILGGIAGAMIGGTYSSTFGGTLAGLAGGAIVGGAIGAYVDSYATPRDRLDNRGVNVIILGDQILLVLPSYIIFNENSATIRPPAYETLDQVAAFLSKYPNMTIQVAGYTSAMDSPAVSCALSQQQADVVAKYLWKAGLNTRLLYSIGMGGSKLVTANSYDWSSDNYRIEISLEKLPV